MILCRRKFSDFNSVVYWIFNEKYHILASDISSLQKYVMRSWIANFTASWKNSSKSEIPQAALYSTILIRQPLCIEKIFFCPLIYFFLEKNANHKSGNHTFFPDNYMLFFPACREMVRPCDKTRHFFSPSYFGFFFQNSFLSHGWT